MTTRRSLTQKERRDMWARQRFRCALCDSRPDLKDCIAEHIHPVALGNAEKPDCLLCKSCADRKTNGTKATTYGSDKHAIAKVKRLALKQAKKWRKPARPMRSRGFEKTLRKKMNGEVVQR